MTIILDQDIEFPIYYISIVTQQQLNGLIDNNHIIMSTTAVSGPPYALPIAMVGGVPTPSVDDPIAGVLIVIFLSLAAVHMTILQTNMKKEHKFIFSGLLFGLSMARTAAMVMRIVWASYPTNTSIALAANILTQAGVVILFVANLFFAQRIVRAYHPRVGWHNAARAVFRFLVFAVIACLVMIIICTVHMSFTLDRAVQDMERKVQLTGSTFFAVLAFIPTPAVLIAVLTSDREKQRPEKFGTGRLRTKVRLLIFTSLLLTLGAGFRLGTSFDSRPVSAPAWFHHKACYYVFNFAIEIIVSATYAAVRFDRRFHIPNGAKGPGDYAAGYPAKGEQTDNTNSGPRFTGQINTEAETFGDDDGDETEVGSSARDEQNKTMDV